MVSKFPIITESGNEYRVEIYEEYDWGQYVASVYVKSKLLWFNRWKFVSGGSFGGRYRMKEWGYNLIKIAKHAVKKYEDNLESERIHKQRIKESYEIFEKWDGKVN